MLQSKEKNIERVKSLLDLLVENENWPMTLLIGDYLSKLEPESILAYRAMGYASLEMHDLDESEKYLQKALELGDSDPDTRIQIARIFSYRGDLNSQMYWLEKALEENPNKIVAAYFLARACRSLGDVERAEELLKGIIESQPDLVPPRRTLADLYLSAGNLDGAEEQLREAIALRDDIGGSLSDLGYILKTRKMYPEALEVYFQALEKNPDNATRYYDIGDTFLYLGETEQAISYLRKAKELDPGNSLFNYDLSLAFFNARRYKECEDASRGALRFDPEMMNARTNIGLNATTNLGLAFLNQGKLEDAEACFRKNLQLTASSYFNLGLALFRQKKYDDALSTFLHAVELVPNNAEYWDLVGNAWMESGDLDNAKEALERAIGLDGAYVPAIYDLGVVFSRKKGEETEAKKLFKQAIALDKEYPLPHYAIACLYALENKKKPALNSLRKAILLGFNDRKHVDNDHDFDAFRDDEEFKQIIAKMGASGKDRFCAEIEVGDKKIQERKGLVSNNTIKRDAAVKKG